MPFVKLAEAEAPLILALDLGTSSLRALLFDRHGRAIRESECQMSHELRTTPDGGAESDAASLFDLLTHCIDGALSRAGSRARQIEAVGTSCFWHSLLGLTHDDEPATPLFTWADKRAGAAAATLRRELATSEVHARTGCVLHSSYWPAKLRWLGRCRPEVVTTVARWVSFAEYAALRLHGEMQVSLSMASGTGLLDVHGRHWDQSMLRVADLTEEQLSPLTDRDEPFVGLLPPFARRWPALADAPWFPGIGDGAAANVGGGAVGPERMALTLGTSGAMRLIIEGERIPVPSQVWAYRLDRHHYVLGGALSNGGNLAAWLGELLGDADLDALTEAATGIEPDGHGLTLLPFLAGERSPSWRDDASGVIAGLTLATGQTSLFRAMLEAVAYRFAAIHDALQPLAARPYELIANGGAILRSPLWLQIMADTLNHDLTALPPDEEASARGAAITALDASGIRPGLSMPLPEAAVYRPDPARHKRYQAGRQRQRRLERAMWEVATAN